MDYTETIAHWKQSQAAARATFTLELKRESTYIEYQLARIAWTAELEFMFGESEQSRYTQQGRRLPGFVRFERARLAWERTVTGR